MHRKHTGSHNVGTWFFFPSSSRCITKIICKWFEFFIILQPCDQCVHVGRPGSFMFLTCHTWMFAKMLRSVDAALSMWLFLLYCDALWLPRVGCWKGWMEKKKQRTYTWPFISAFIISYKDIGEVWLTSQFTGCSSQTFHWYIYPLHHYPNFLRLVF